MVVEDDDGVRDTLNTRLGIVDTHSDPLYEEPLGLSGRIQSSVGGLLNMLLLFTLAMMVIAFVTLRLTGGERDSDIPRWISRDKGEQIGADDDDESPEAATDDDEEGASDD